MIRAIRRLCGVTLTVSAAVMAANINAQELRGFVRLPDGATPASGVVAVLMHATIRDSIVARGVTNDRGRFTLRTPANIPTSLRLLRIGFEPMDAGTYSLLAGELIDASFTLHDNRIRLATFDVKAAARCQVQPTGAQLVAQLFQQARTALIASTSALNGTAYARFVNFERQQDRRRKLLTPVSRALQTGATVQPYASIGVDSLDKVGYIVPDGADFMYYAPDADVLLSDKFLTRHCLQLVNGTDSLAGSIGIGFRPVNRGSRVDIQGTLWLDRSTSELQFLEYTYTELPDYARNEGLGGRVEYAQLPGGGWFVSKWSIRMPILTSVPQAVALARSIPLPNRIVTAGLVISGGEVADIRVDDRVLYLNTGAEQAGSLPGDAVLTSVAVPLRPGVDRLADGTNMALDSLSAKSLCGTQLTFRHEGLVLGRVFDASHQTFAGATVKAAWKENFQVTTAIIRWDYRELKTTSVSGGNYLLCGIPVRQGVSISTARAQKFGKASIVRVSEEAPAARIDLTLEPPESRDNDALTPAGKR